MLTDKSDAEILNWVAEHLKAFHIDINDCATMLYVDGSGEDKVVTYTSDILNPTSLYLLKGCLSKVN